MATFAERLNLLFDTVYPPGRGPFRSSEVIKELSGVGITISAPYMSQLRSGTRSEPSEQTVIALSRFFLVDPLFFTDDRAFEEARAELRHLNEARREFRGEAVMDTSLEHPDILDRPFVGTPDTFADTAE
jgi:transcriptional regulator with XRE-family HTH domain